MLIGKTIYQAINPGTKLPAAYKEKYGNKNARYYFK
jgi:hypothetical protein